jgi:D-threo-aldose 1-dehydrogenase
MNDLISQPLARRPLGRSGLTVPILGIGCSTFGDRARRLSAAECEATVAAAMTIGADYFDTAPYYGFGLSERRVGDALRETQSAQTVLSTKVGRLLVPDASIDTTQPRNGFYSAMPFRPVFDYSYDGIMRSYEASLQRLGLARIDMLLVHDIGAFAHGSDHLPRLRELLDGGMRALAELRSSGAIKAVGLGVNEIEVGQEILAHGDLDCILLAGRYTLLEQGGLDSLFPLCLDRGVGIVIGGPYNSGLLAGGTRRRGALRYDYGPAPDHILQHVRKIEQICDAHNVPIAAAALQFPLAHPAVNAVIPGIGSAARVEQTKSLLLAPIPRQFWDDLRTARLVAPDAPLPGDVE